MQRFHNKYYKDMATNAKETAKQENGSRVFFEHVIEKKEPTDEMMLDVYDGYSPEWRDTYRKQGKHLKILMDLVKDMNT